MDFSFLELSYISIPTRTRNSDTSYNGLSPCEDGNLSGSLRLLMFTFAAGVLFSHRPVASAVVTWTSSSVAMPTALQYTVQLSSSYKAHLLNATSLLFCTSGSCSSGTTTAASCRRCSSYRSQQPTWCALTVVSTVTVRRIGKLRYCIATVSFLEVLTTP